jgi:type I restriction enzyme S subunit
VLYPDRSKIAWSQYDGSILLIEKIPFDTGAIIFRDKQMTRTDLYLSGGKAQLVVSKINFHQGAIALINQCIAATTHYEFYALRDYADAEYMWLYLRTEVFKSLFAQEIKFRGFKTEANYKFIQNIFIPLPPLPEQRAIAHVLGAVQRAREATERVITATRELKKSLMRHLFTYGPVPVGATHASPLQDTDIGPIPAHWRVVRLGEVVTLQRGKDLPNKHRRAGTVPVIGSNGIVGFHSVAIVSGPGVCVGRSGSVGKVTWVSEDYWPLNTVLWVKDYHGNDRLFVYYLLSQFDFSRYVSGVSVPTLNRNLVHPALVPLPPLSEQREIARILQAVDRKLAAEEARRQALEALFKTLLRDLMTARRRLPADFVAQFAAGAHGLPPQPTNATHGG